jgi:anti-anti-sigma factor
MSDALGAEPFDVELEARGDEVWVLPTGDLDLASAPELQESLGLALRSEATAVVIDLRGLDLLDSTGLRVLLEAALGPDGRRVSFVRGGERVETVLRVSGLSDKLPFREPGS